MFILGCCLQGGALFANPQGPRVVHGDVSFQSTHDSLLQITASDGSILNWESFSIDAHELTQFIQPSMQSAVLNRVQGTIPSSILGTLQANGKVYLINPNGILVGPSGCIDTASILLSTLSLSDADFLANGDLCFEGISDGKIANLGTISALGGDAVLLGHFVENQGSILAPEGNCLIGAGHEILLCTGDENKLLIRLQNQSEQTGTGIDQNGQIEAMRSEIKADGNLYALAIKHSGKSDAICMQSSGGEMYLVAEEGSILIEGSLTVPKELHIFGEEIILGENATIDATYPDHGGAVYIGGIEEGRDSVIPQAETVYIAPGARIDASAQIKGDGGRVVLWSNQGTWMHGEILAQGGLEMGDGGFVEISSHGLLEPQGHVSTLAPFGTTGTLLLDPSAVTIGPLADSGLAAVPPPYTFNALTAHINAANLVALLGSNQITIAAGLSGTAAQGSITVQSALTWNSTHALTLTSNATSGDFITINAPITNMNAGIATGSDCIVISSPNVTINADLSTASGDVRITGSTGTTVNDAVNISTALTGSMIIRGGALSAETTGSAIHFATEDGDLDCHVTGDILTTNPGIGVFFSTVNGDLILISDSGNITLDFECQAFCSGNGSATVTCSNGALTLNPINSAINTGNGQPITINANSLLVGDGTHIGSSASGLVTCTIAGSAQLLATNNTTTITGGTGGLVFSADSLTLQAPSMANITRLEAYGGTLTCNVGGAALLELVSPGTGDGIAQIINHSVGGAVVFTADSLTVNSGTSGSSSDRNGIIATAGDVTCTVTHDITLNSQGWDSCIRNISTTTNGTVSVTSTMGNLIMNGGVLGGHDALIDSATGDVHVNIPQGNITMDVQNGGTRIIGGSNGAIGSLFVTTGGNFIGDLSGGAGSGGIGSTGGDATITVGGHLHIVGGVSSNAFTLSATNALDIILTGDFNMLHDTTTPFVSGPNGFMLLDSGQSLSISRPVGAPGLTNLTGIGGSGSNGPILLFSKAVDINLNGDITLTGGTSPSNAGLIDFTAGVGGSNRIAARNITLLGGTGSNTVTIGCGLHFIPAPTDATVELIASENLTIGLNAAIVTLGTMPTNDITISAGNLIVDAGGSILSGTGMGDGGSVSITTTGSVAMNGTVLNPAIIRMSAASPGDMTILANQNISLNSPDVIEVLGPGVLFLAVDEAPPYNVSPNIGPGLLNISAGAVLSTAGGALRMYGAIPAQTAIDPGATFNGVSISPAFEELGVWYPGVGSESGVPYALYFKAAVHPPSPPSPNSRLTAVPAYARFQTAVSEAFQEWDLFDPYYQTPLFDVSLTYQTDRPLNSHSITSFDVFKMRMYHLFSESYHTYNTLKLTPF